MALALSLLEDEEVDCMPLNAGPSLICLPKLSLLDLGTYPSLPVLVTGVPQMLPLLPITFLAPGDWLPLLCGLSRAEY